MNASLDQKLLYGSMHTVQAAQMNIVKLIYSTTEHNLFNDTYDFS